MQWRALHQRYLAITQNMVEPDPLKIKYRETLIQAVQMVVKGLMLPQTELIAQVANQLVKASDRDAFMQMFLEALRNMHEGSVLRYRLRRSEYLAWRQICENPNFSSTLRVKP